MGTVLIVTLLALIMVLLGFARLLGHRMTGARH
jgi:hypothetical protein